MAVRSRERAWRIAASAPQEAPAQRGVGRELGRRAPPHDTPFFDDVVAVGGARGGPDAFFVDEGRQAPRPWVPKGGPHPGAPAGGQTLPGSVAAETTRAGHNGT